MNTLKYNWQVIPEEVGFMATDQDGVACGWLVEPKIMGNAWRNQSHLSAYFYIQARDNYLNHYRGDWRESLEKRPDNNQDSCIINNTHECREAFDIKYKKLHPDDKCAKMKNGNYSGWVKQAHWWGYQIRQDEIDDLKQQLGLEIVNKRVMAKKAAEQLIEKDKLIDELKHLATELVEYTSYAEIIGAISHDRQPIREFCDKIYAFNKRLEETPFGNAVPGTE